MRAYIILLILVFLSNQSYAQTLEGQHEFMFSAGWLSGRQLSDALGGERVPVETMATPSYFAGYRYFVRDKFAIGLTVGSQTIWGKNSDENNYNPYTYKVTNSTAAAEVTYVFWDFERFQYYSLFGAGISHFMEQDVFSVPTPSSSSYSGNKFNFQYSAGIRFGGKFVGFLEAGLGYKGLLNGGLSYKFNNGKLRHKEEELRNLSAQEIIVLPDGFPVDNDLKSLGLVKTGNPASSVPGNFDEQMNKISQNVKLLNGNVFQLSYIWDQKQSNNYNIVGNAWYAPDYKSYKATVQSEKKLRFENNTCAYFVIYRPDYNHSINSGMVTKVTINDTTVLELKNNTRYIIKLTKEGSYKVALSNGDHAATVDVKYGYNYYIKATVKRPKGFQLFRGHSTLSTVDDLKGELESSVITNTHVMDILTR